MKLDENEGQLRNRLRSLQGKDSGNSRKCQLVYVMPQLPFKAWWKLLLQTADRNLLTIHWCHNFSWNQCSPTQRLWTWCPSLFARIVNLLGHNGGREGISPDPTKISEVLFGCALTYYRRFFSNFVLNCSRYKMWLSRWRKRAGVSGKAPLPPWPMSSVGFLTTVQWSAVSNVWESWLVVPKSLQNQVLLQHVV